MTQTGLSNTFRRDLAHALNVRSLPEALAVALTRALEDYQPASTHRGRLATALQQWEAATRVHDAALALQQAITRADAACGIRISPSRAKHSTGFIYSSWHAIEAPLARMTKELQVWCVRETPTRRRRGQPHPGRRELRWRVFTALEEAGVALTNGTTGQAARVVAVVLAEADRLDGKHVDEDVLPRDRAYARLNGSEWTRWIADYRDCDRLFRDWEAHGFSFKWLTARAGK